MDSAGQNLGPDGYQQVIAALDAPLGRLADACRKNNVLLAVTADHGMVFPGEKGKGGHSAEKYAARLEALRVPLVFLGPGIEELNLGGRWMEMDIAPTVLGILNISGNLSGEGRSMPIRQSYTLRISGAPGGLALWQGEERLADGSAGECCFWGLPRGQYSIKAEWRVWQVTVNGDTAMDLAGKEAPLGSGTKKMIGIILILAINLAGIAIIIRIWKRG